MTLGRLSLGVILFAITHLTNHTNGSEGMGKRIGNYNVNAFRYLPKALQRFAISLGLS
jgi:hypothetical protein